MGWKTNTVIVRPALLRAGPENLLEQLGYEKYRKIKDVPFVASGSGSIWIGAIGDCVLICTVLAECFFDEFVDDPADEEFVFFKNALFRVFPDAEIVALALNNVVDAWGYAVFRSGKLVRRSYGHDGVIHGDEGSWLPTERAYFENCERTEVDGEILYRTRDPRCEPLSVAFHGTSLVFEVCQSVTGYKFDARQLQDAPGVDFWLDDDEEKFLARTG